MAESRASMFSPMTSLLSPTLREIAELSDVQRVKSAIIIKYGFVPTDEYCRDLIVFVKELTSEPRE